MKSVWLIDKETIFQNQLQSEDLSRLLMSIYDNLHPKAEILKILISHDEKWDYWIADIFYREME
jgi:hypothetical protein